MKHPASLAVLILPLVMSAPAAAAQRNFGISGFDQVRVAGPYAVTVTTGIAPFARATGSQSGIDHVAMRVQGTTLVIGQDRNGGSSDNGGPVTIAIGTHELSRGSIEGVGTITVDHARGLRFALAVAGAGTANIASVDVDQFQLAMEGSGSVKLDGRAPMMTAIVRGAGTINAAGLSVKDLTITAQGPAVVSATATDTAKITAVGAASITLSGRPSCTLKTVGSASVSGCR